MRDNLPLWTLLAIAPYPLVALVIWLAITGYADVLAGLVALAMVVSGIWLSAKGMARLKQHETGAISGTELEIAYRYRNAGIALGLTGSGLLVFSWETFLGRFIGAASPGM
jgi:hypothetical protein